MHGLYDFHSINVSSSRRAAFHYFYSHCWLLLCIHRSPSTSRQARMHWEFICMRNFCSVSDIFESQFFVRAVWILTRRQCNQFTGIHIERKFCAMLLHEQRRRVQQQKKFSALKLPKIFIKSRGFSVSDYKKIRTASSETPPAAALEKKRRNKFRIWDFIGGGGRARESITAENLLKICGCAVICMNSTVCW